MRGCYPIHPTLRAYSCNTCSSCTLERHTIHWRRKMVWVRGATIMTWPDPGGVLGVTGLPPPPPPPHTHTHSTAIYKCRSIRISLQAWRIEKHENGNSFFGGGGEGGVRGSRNLGGGSASFKLLTTKDSQKLMIYMQFSHSVTPPP